jgi:molybdate transport repressor ModE-like protein
MKKTCKTPPECCVVIEMEKGATLGFKKAVLLNEIEALGSLAKAAKVSKIDDSHARELIVEMNCTFSHPLVYFLGNSKLSDQVELTEKGRSTVQTYWKRFEPIWLSIIEERSRHF